MRRIIGTLATLSLVAAVARCGGSFSVSDEPADGSAMRGGDSDVDLESGADATRPSDAASGDGNVADRSEPRDSAGHDATADGGKSDAAPPDDGGKKSDGSIDDDGSPEDGGEHDGGELHDASDADLRDVREPRDAEVDAHAGGDAGRANSDGIWSAGP